MKFSVTPTISSLLLTDVPSVTPLVTDSQVTLRLLLSHSEMLQLHNVTCMYNIQWFALTMLLCPYYLHDSSE